MADLKIFWLHPQTPQGYHKQITQFGSGTIDEKIIEKFINSYLPTKKGVIVDLGIGTGRELAWLDKVQGVEKIIGIDYSPAMLAFCREEITAYQHKVELIQDDLLKPKVFPKVVQQEKSPIVYISLINTFGNFEKSERIFAMRNITKVLKKSDRLVLALYKRSQHARLAELIKKAPYLQAQNPSDQPILAELIEYGLLPFFWTSVIDRYNQLPRFWYDKEHHDLVIHIDGKRLFTSHRFTKEEIEEEFRQAGLRVERIIEGRAMWIAVGQV